MVGEGDEMIKQINNLNEWDGNSVAVFTKEGLFEMSTAEYHSRIQPQDVMGQLTCVIVDGVIVRHNSGPLEGDLIRHRKDGPAVLMGNIREWYYENKLHRMDGPAVECVTSVSRVLEFFIDNRKLHKEDYDAIILEVESLTKELRLTDPRWWVREWKT
jgi:hypothetical protein